MLKKMKKRSNINTIYFMIGLPYIIINYLVINYYNFLVFFKFVAFRFITFLTQPLVP
jgi:hypothetical protein